MQTQINWESFSVYNQDARGIRYKFEDLCRQLFTNENLSKKEKKYLHVNPNNAGLEADPIYDEKTKCWIGFQVKYFDNNVDYDQIKHSAEKIIEYYAGRVDAVYLFCNKPLTLSAKGYVDAASILQTSGITLEPITDNAILDLVRKYPYLGLYYFGNHTLMHEWFATHTSHMQDELGIRYNRDFNVNTSANDELSLFVQDQNAAKQINNKKTELLKKVGAMYGERDEERSYLCAVRQAVNDLPDVTTRTLQDAFGWRRLVESATAEFCDQVEEKRKKLQNQRDEQNALAHKKEGVSKEQITAAYTECYRLDNQIKRLNALIELPCLLEIADRDRQLLEGDVLTVFGDPGTGKSQLLAHKTQQLIDAGRASLLLVAGIYFTAEPIHEQIMKNLRLDFSFEDLIDILEAIGEKDDCIIPIFIDALNETWNYRLWKSGLPAIIEKVKQSAMVKLVLTYRSEYEKQLIPDSVLQQMKTGDVVTLCHRGFADNSIDAVRSFLNHFNISFTPLEYFSYEMSKPLFLLLYCKTYNGEEVSLPALYERLIEHANINIYKSMKDALINNGYSEDDNILNPLIFEIAATMVSKNTRIISKTEINQLTFWSEYGIAPAPFLRQLEKEQILHNTVHDEKEIFYFAYDQMNDYFCAKAIFKTCNRGQEVRQYLTDNILHIRSNELGNYGNIGLFVNACALYAEKFGEECIDIIEQISDENDKQIIISRYIGSFQWRRSNTIATDSFKDLLRTYMYKIDDVWEMLIGNSVKTSNPLNADFLHKLLYNYELNRRDYLWTIYINGFGADYSNRITQLIQMYNRGEKLEFKTEKQVELLLTLFGWLLTSSNRWLRDNASKAMIEVLKEHFSLCQTLLQKFEGVNDPYVFQRLHGIVFGACCKKKRTDSDCFKVLAEYVYSTIFNKDTVYPDILLRDYARLIIVRFLYENPNYDGSVDTRKIVPPYKSEPIPEIEDQHYLEKKYSGALFWLIHSMRFEGMGMYGDFGRYVFQAALQNFEVDDKRIFNYAVYFILNELKYSEDYFGEYDRYHRSFDRHMAAKTERIGKKYQWIAMYNILSRVSDHCRMVDKYCFQETDEIPFEGAWEPYVRDFDPTLNQNFMVYPDAPHFKFLDDFATAAVEENACTNISSAEQQRAWLDSKGVFHQNLKNALLLKDVCGTEWVTLSAYFDTGREDLDIKKLYVWSWLYAYFVSPEQKKEFESCANKGLSVITRETASHHETYTVFNREYPWAPSCRSFNESAWVDASLKTGEKETVHETIKVPDLSAMEEFIKKLGYLDEQDDAWNDECEELDNEWGESPEVEIEMPEIGYKEVTHEVEVKKEIGKILHASSDLLWEEEYDASKEDALSWNVPCAMLIETLHLQQLEADGFYFDSDGKLAAFDVDLTQNLNCIVVRKDLLDSFISSSGMELIWLMKSEKEIHASDRSILQWSEWEALFTYEKDRIDGSIRRTL